MRVNGSRDDLAEGGAEKKDSIANRMNKEGSNKVSKDQFMYILDAYEMLKQEQKQAQQLAQG